VTPSVVDFFTNDALVGRYRSGFSISLEDPVGLTDSESKLVAFLVDGHGGGVWHLQFSKNQGERAIYENEGGWHDGLRVDSLYLVADSFAEFLRRSCAEIRESEKSKTWIQKAAE